MAKLNRTHAIIIAAVAAVCVVVAVVAVGNAQTGGAGGPQSEEQQGMGLQDYLDLGNQRLADLDFEGAVLAFRNAIQIDPNSQDAIDGLTTAYYQWAGSETRGGNYPHALEILTNAQSDLPDDEQFPVLYQSVELSSNMHELLDPYQDGFSDDYINSVADKANASGAGTGVAFLDVDSDEAALWNTIEKVLPVDGDAKANLIRLCDENGGTCILEDYSFGIYSWDEDGGRYSYWTQDKYFSEGFGTATIKGYGIYVGDYENGKRSDDSALWITFSVPTATNADGESYLGSYDHAWCYQATRVAFVDDAASGTFYTREASSARMAGSEYSSDSITLLSGEVANNYFNGTVTAYCSGNNYQATLSFDNGTLLSSESVSRSDGSVVPLDQSYGTMQTFDAAGNLTTETLRYGLYGLSWFDHYDSASGHDGGNIVELLDSISFAAPGTVDNTTYVQIG